MIWLTVTRALRGAVWGGAAFLSLWTLGTFEQRMLKYDTSAMQQSARATVGIFELLTALIVAIALDRILELRERRLLERSATSRSTSATG